MIDSLNLELNISLFLFNNTITGYECNSVLAAEMDVGLSELDEPEEPLQFKVDHPFIFLILHQNAVLFIGKKSFID